MGHGQEDALAKTQRKRGLSQADPEHKPPEAKRQAIDMSSSSTAALSAEEVRASVRTLYLHYQTLCNGSRDAPDEGAFTALLQASQGGVGCQRLAARLVPRFIGLFPDQVEAAAVALRRLYEQQQDPDAPNKSLEEQTRKEALHGLQAVLQAAQPGSQQATLAVKRILGVLLKLLPQVEMAEQDGEEEREEEEGELAAPDTPAAHGPWLRRVLRQALRRHPTTTLAFCFSCLGAAAAAGKGGAAGTDVGVLQGVRMWLKDHLLKEGSPSREGTPLLGDGHSHGGTAAAAAAAAGGGGGGAAAAAANGTGGTRTCVLQSVLAASQELQAWVMQQARGRGTAPPEVRTVLETALQLLPAHQQLAAAKPQLEPRLQRAASMAAASGGGGGGGPGGPGGASAWERQRQQQPHHGPNGMVPRLVNGMELNRSWSTPVGPDRAGSRPGPGGKPRQPSPQQPGAADGPWGHFPRPGGPICRVEPCLLAANLPRHISRADVQSELGAEEVWLLEPPPGAGGGARACCVFKSPVDAAKAFLRHHGQRRFGAQAPLLLYFTDRLPPCSRAAAAAAAAPSCYVWAAQAVTDRAEELSEAVREANLYITHVHRVNNKDVPGTLLQTPDARTAGQVVAHLLAKHAAAAAGYQQGPEEPPPLPQEAPPPGDWPQGGGGGAPGPPRGPGGRQPGPGGAPRHPPQAQQLPPGYGQQLLPQQQGQAHGQQQQHTGGPPGFRRTSSMPVPGPGVGGSAAGPPKPAGGAGGWRDSPNTPTHRPEWGTPTHPQQQQQQLPPSHLQPQGSWQQRASPGWQHGTPPQQQPGAAGNGRWGAATSSPAPPGPSNSPHQQQQRLLPAGLAAGGPGSNTSSPGGVLQPPLPPGTVAGPGAAAAAAAVAAAGPAGSLPSPLPLPPGQQPGHGGGRVMWRGSLAKQAIRMCGVLCLEVGGPARATGLAPEPRLWPDPLQVNHRISVADALTHYRAAAPNGRALRVLVPLDPGAGDEAQLRAFIEYLNSKDRAGMVKLPPEPQAGLGPRALYLVVPRAQVCQALQVAWDGQCAMLIAVVVPQGGGGGSAGGNAHQQPAAAAAGAPPPPLPPPQQQQQQQQVPGQPPPQQQQQQPHHPPNGPGRLMVPSRMGQRPMR